MEREKKMPKIYKVVKVIPPEKIDAGLRKKGEKYSFVDSFPNVSDDPPDKRAEKLETTDLGDWQEDNNLMLNYTFRRENPQLSVYEYGMEKCYPKHSFGPTRRDYFILHYVFKGEGKYKILGNTFPVKEGDFFLIPPDVTTFYCACEQNPWNYYWVGFNGLEAKKLLELSGFFDKKYVLTYRGSEKVGDAMKSFLSVKDKSFASELALLGKLYFLFSLLIKGNESNRKGERSEDSVDFVTKAIEYIHAHHADNISVGSLANYVGLERSYFYRVFKGKMFVSPQRYIMNIRMTKAQILIREGRLKMNEIAAKVGYDNYSNFQKTFRKQTKITPREYAKSPFETE